MYNEAYNISSKASNKCNNISDDISNKISTEHLLYLKKIKKRKFLILLTQILIFIMFFVIWEVFATLKWVDPFIFSKPTRIISSTIKMILEGSFFIHIGVTLSETIGSFIISTLVGILISIFLWWNNFFQKVLEPYLVVLNSLPKTALAPIIIVIFGTNIKSIIITSVLTSIIVTILTVLSGFMEVSKEKVKLIKTFGGTKKQILFKVILPASIPALFNALKINIGLSFVGVIVGEFLVAQSGLGYLIVYGSQVFKMDWVMMSVIVLCILAAFLYWLVSVLEKKYCRK